MIFWKHLSETHERGSEIHESIATITQNTFQDSDNIIQKNQISKKKSFRPRPPPPPKKMTGSLELKTIAMKALIQRIVNLELMNFNI